MNSRDGIDPGGGPPERRSSFGRFDAERAGAAPGEPGTWLDPSTAGTGQCPYLSDAAPNTGGAFDDSGENAPGPRECLAFDEALPLSDRQRDLVCLRPIHETCPRYMRATVVDRVPGEWPARASEGGPRLGGTRARLAAVAICLVVVAGLLWLKPSFPGLRGAAGSATSTSSAPAETTPTPTPGVPSPSPTPAASVTVTVSHAPTTSPTGSWPPGATASRMSLVRPCTGVAGCYLYTIRKGETLTSIAAFFGLGADAILKLNPAIVNPDRIVAGQVIKLPPPTR